MFTGIIECMGSIEQITKDGSNLNINLSSPISSSLKIDQSVAHNGICLTVVDIKDNKHTVTAIKESIDRTDIKDWEVGSKINLERCMPASGRFDGHIVQGHVDCVAICTKITSENGSYRFYFSLNQETKLMVEKGSICINGISLTLVDAEPNSFSVAIIPYTLENTNLKKIQVQDKVNIEFDILGKYISKMIN